jgi:hypothetical protein
MCNTYLKRIHLYRGELSEPCYIHTLQAKLADKICMGRMPVDCMLVSSYEISPITILRPRPEKFFWMIDSL